MLNKLCHPSALQSWFSSAVIFSIMKISGRILRKLTYLSPRGEGNEEVEVGVGGRPVCHHTPLFLFNHLCACVTYSKITRILLLTLRLVKFWLGSFSSPSGIFPYSALLSLIITSTTSTCCRPFTWCCSQRLPLLISFSPLASQWEGSTVIQILQIRKLRLRERSHGQ